MKRISTLLICAVVALSASLAAYAESPFSALQSQPDVTRIYISKAMMRLGMRQLNGINKEQLSGSLPLGPSTVLDDMEIYTCNSAKSAAKAQSLYDDYMKNSPKFQELLILSENDEKTVICGLPGDKEGFFKTMLIYISEPDENTIIIINGKIEFSDIDG